MSSEMSDDLLSENSQGRHYPLVARSSRVGLPEAKDEILQPDLFLPALDLPDAILRRAHEDAVLDHPIKPDVCLRGNPPQHGIRCSDEGLVPPVVTEHWKHVGLCLLESLLASLSHPYVAHENGTRALLIALGKGPVRRLLRSEDIQMLEGIRHPGPSRPSRPLNSLFNGSANPDGRVGFLDRPWSLADILEREVSALKTELLFGPA